jgi:hypothetical protein
MILDYLREYPQETPIWSMVKPLIQRVFFQVNKSGFPCLPH